MTLYAASNLCWVAVSAEGHGGCGNSHSRPVENGAPVKVWALDCPRCEDHLRHDKMWSVTVSEIPETHDEKLAREDFERRGAKDKDAVLTLALARIAGIDSAELPESLTRMISGAPLHVPVQGQVECPSGHAQRPGMKFCGECGAPMSGPVPKAALNGPELSPAPSAAAPPAQSGFRPQRLSDARLEQLQAIAAQKGLATGGNRKELVDRLSGAGVSNADFREFLAAA